MEFFDRARIYVKAGNGGNGSKHFRRERFVTQGGPDGGDAGRGGTVFFEADPNINTLVDFHYNQRFVAEDGGNGLGNRMHGKAGEDLIINIPAGTLVRRADTGEILGDLTMTGQRVQVARGGRGGLGNTHFATPTNRSPREAQLGEPGEELELTLELKLIADVGLVGLPNAGKSTLLSIVTAARPKIANYPFTTLVPNLGVAAIGDIGDSQSFVIADIPGLIEGAAEGIGLGHDFLRHVERTRLLLHLIDGDNLAMDPWDEFETINRELAAYRPELVQLEQIVVFTKMDLPTARERWPEAEAKAREHGIPIYPISAPAREGVQELLNFTAERLREIPLRPLPEVAASSIGEGMVTLRPVDDNHFTVTREADGIFVVHGKRAERLAVMTDTSTEEAVVRLEKHLRRLGVEAALERAGVHHGDIVRLGKVDLTWGGGEEDSE